MNVTTDERSTGASARSPSDPALACPAPEADELAHGQRIGGAPRDPTLGDRAFEIADPVKRSGSIVLDLLIVDLRGHVACPQASLGEAGATPLHNVEGARHLSKRDRHPVTASQVPAPGVSEPPELADMETVPKRERIPSVSVQHSRVRGEVGQSWREREVVGGVQSTLTDGVYIWISASAPIFARRAVPSWVLRMLPLEAWIGSFPPW